MIVVDIPVETDRGFKSSLPPGFRYEVEAVADQYVSSNALFSDLTSNAFLVSHGQHHLSAGPTIGSERPSPK